MSATLIEPRISDDERRRSLYAGDILFHTPRASTQTFCEHAWQLIAEAFDPIDPAKAQFELSVEKFVEIIAPLKTRFTHHPRSKQLLTDVLEDFGCEIGDTYFDVPKLRIVSSDGYLTSGVGYAYKSHRDTWYACPQSQINWWLPVSEITERCALVLHPQYFDRPVKNNSGDFDAYRWNAEGRKSAAQYINSDPRPHPHLQEAIELDREVLVGRPGSAILFSAQHLHGTIPNDSGRTRFSIDFRTVNRQDIEAHAGATLIDNASTGTTLRDFLCAKGYQGFPESTIEQYEVGGKREGVLVFDPSELGHQVR